MILLSEIYNQVMEITTHEIQVTKQARYAAYGNLTEQTKYFWFALHGSKMLCEQLLYKFENFDPNEHFVIAPEGLSRFYLNGFGGDVVATWMTSRDRLMEISDFSDYLSKLYNLYTKKLNTSATKIVLGFSQGGTTAMRWLHHNQVDLDHLLLYASWIPEDIDLQASQTKLKSFSKHYTYGTEDQFLSESRIEGLNKVISKNDLSIQMYPYSGKHRIEKSQLEYLFESIIRRP